MSRIGKRPIPFDNKVEVSLKGDVLRVKGPKGALERTVHPKISVRIENNTVFVERKDEEQESRALHGLFRALLSNMIVGVTTGFTRILDVKGTG